MPQTKKYIFGIFIIEGLNSEDFFDGSNLKEILDVARIQVIYREALSKDSLIVHLREFNASGSRYLHLSCHAVNDGICINNEMITVGEIATALGTGARSKRVFLSACHLTSDLFANQMIGNCNIQSVIGSPGKVLFEKAAVFWPAFYYSAACVDKDSMKKFTIKNILRKFTDLFDLPFIYYSRINGSKDSFRCYKVTPGKPTINKRIDFF